MKKQIITLVVLMSMGTVARATEDFKSHLNVVVGLMEGVAKNKVQKKKSRILSANTKDDARNKIEALKKEYTGSSKIDIRVRKSCDAMLEKLEEYQDTTSTPKPTPTPTPVSTPAPTKPTEQDSAPTPALVPTPTSDPLNSDPNPTNSTPVTPASTTNPTPTPASTPNPTTPTEQDPAPTPALVPTPASGPLNSDPNPTNSTPVTPTPAPVKPEPTAPAKDFAKDLVAANGQITALKAEIAALNQKGLDAEFIDGTRIKEKKVELVKELGNACKVDDCKEVVASDPASEQNVTDANAVVTQLTEKKAAAEVVLKKLKAAVALSKIQAELAKLSDDKKKKKGSKVAELLALDTIDATDTVETMKAKLTALIDGDGAELKDPADKTTITALRDGIKEDVVNNNGPNPTESRLTRKNGLIATFVVAALYELYSGFTTMNSMNRIARAGGKERVGFLTALGKTMSGQARSVKNFVVDLFASEENDDE